MTDQIHEHCFTCGHYGGKGICKRAFIIHIIIVDGHGSVRIEVMPGSVPAHLETTVQKMLTGVVSRFMSQTIMAHPVWKEIKEWQEANPDRSWCPAREAMSQEAKPLLKIIKFEK